MNQKPRIKELFNQLDSAAHDYVRAKEDHEITRLRFETTYEKLSALKRLASNIAAPEDMMHWGANHQELQYVGSAMGDAIHDVLQGRAYEASHRAVEDKMNMFFPGMGLHEIAGALEEGGFQFKTAMHVREVNAALIHLKSVVKVHGQYRVKNADEIFEDVKEITRDKEDSLRRS